MVDKSIYCPCGKYAFVPANDEVRTLTAENEDLRRNLSVAVDMAKCNADRIDALATAIEGMDANAVTGDAPTGQAIVQYDDYNTLIELAQSMRNGTQVDGDTHLSGYAAENAKLREQLAEAVHVLNAMHTEMGIICEVGFDPKRWAERMSALNKAGDVLAKHLDVVGFKL